MKTFIRGLLFLLVLFLALFSPFSPASGKTYQGQVVKVFDGDTLLVRIKGHEEFVRLREIDAPEMASRKQQGQEPWGRKAKEFALSRLKDRKVRLETENRDERDAYHRLLAYVFVGESLLNREMVESGNAFFYRPPVRGRFAARLETDNRDERDAYGRLLAYVFVGESLLNREMVESGNAFFYRAPVRGSYAARLEEAENSAREKGLGVWDQTQGLKERPRDFRARHQGDESLFSSLKRFPGRDRNSRSFQENPVPGDKIVGNKRTMVYHLPGSPSTARVSPKNRVFFDSAEEAEKAGFRKSRSYS